MICVREIGDLVDKELRFRHFSFASCANPAQPKRSKIIQIPTSAAVEAFFARMARYPSSTVPLLANARPRRPRAAVHFFEAKKDPVAIQTAQRFYAS